MVWFHRSEFSRLYLPDAGPAPHIPRLGCAILSAVLRTENAVLVVAAVVREAQALDLVRDDGRPCLR